MPKIYQQLIDKAVINGVITPKQYLQIPWNDRDSMQYLFSFGGRRALARGDITFEQYLQVASYERKDVMTVLRDPDTRQAIAAGIITLEKYLQIPWNERGSMKYLFSPDGRQAVADGVITLEEYLQIPWNDRDSIQDLFSFDGRRALADGITTLEQYLQVPSYELKMDLAVDNSIIKFERFLQIPWHERGSMRYLFSPDGRQAIVAGIITLEEYLQIPCKERNSMQYLFSPDGRQAFAEGLITLEEYLQIPWYERNSMKYLFSPDGRQALADGLITLEEYLQIPWYKRQSMEYLFSPDGRQALADGIITLEQYLQIRWNEHQNVMTALRDPDTRRRIRNGEITIENFIGVQRARDVAVRPINGAQNTHTASVHQSVSESASRLLNLYESGINGAGLEKTIEKEQNYINSLSDDSPKNRAAKRGFSRIVAIDYIFTDLLSEVSIRQLLALTFLAIHDDEKRVGSLEDAKMQFVEALYEIQRGYNLSETGIDDQKDKDEYICSAGTFNKLIEKLQGIHPDCRILYITIATASLKLPIVVREESMRYLATFVKSHMAEKLLTFNCLMVQIKKEGVEVIWEHIKNNVSTCMFDEFGCLYRDRIDPGFTALVEAGKDGVLKEEDLNKFQEQVERDYLSQHRYDGSEAQKEDAISSGETFLVEVGKDGELDDLNTFQEQVQSGSHLSQHSYDGSEAQKEDVIAPQKLIYVISILLLQLKLLENHLYYHRLCEAL